MDQNSRALLACLRHEVGVKETFANGHWTNLGEKVQEYQSADTLPGVGYSWCVSLLAWGFLKTFGRANADKIWLRSASCDLILAWAKTKGIFNFTPEPGCMGLVLASKSDATHGFAVDDVLSSGKTIATIEGNTNIDGSREGNGVYARKRTVTSRLGFVHWQKLETSDILALTLPANVPIIKTKSPLDGAQTRDLYFGNGLADSGIPLIDGSTWLPAYKWATWMNASLGWVPESQTVLIDGREVPSQPILIDGRAWIKTRALAKFSGLQTTSIGNRVVISQ